MRVDVSQVFVQSGVVVDDMSAKDSGNVPLLVDGVEIIEDDASLNQSSAVKNYTDRTLMSMINKLVGLNMPVTEETIENMRNIVQKHPGLSLDEAAFLASNKLLASAGILNDVEQIVYMQLPVQLNEEQKVGDLYVFKRRRDKGEDPENVNVLLAIDLEFMGHWEALLSIKGKEVSIRMEVSGEAEKEQFDSNTVLLQNMLQEVGFKLVSTDINISIIEEVAARPVFDSYIDLKQGVVDFVV